MEEKYNRHIIDILFVIALFCIFAMSAVFLISIGADIYGKTVSNMDDNFNDRTAYAYVMEKIRQSDAEGSLSVGELQGSPALLISQVKDDTRYITYLYEYNGFLKELMVRSDVPLGPEAGQDIIAVSSFSLQKVNDRLYEFFITADSGKSYQLYVAARSGLGGNEYES